VTDRPALREDELDADYRSALRRARVKVPPDRDPVMRAAYNDMQLLLRVLDEPLAYGDETGVVFRASAPR
jgi:hypothetical protein